MRGMYSDQQAPGDIRAPVPLSAEDMDAYRLQEGVGQSTIKKNSRKSVNLKNKQTKQQVKGAGNKSCHVHMK